MAKRRSKAWIIWLVILGLLGGAGYYFQDKLPDKLKLLFFWKKKGAEEVKYRTEKVSKKDISKLVAAAGQLMPILNIEIGSEVSGIIEEIYVDFNSKVKKGDKLCQINSETTRAQVTSAEAEKLNSEARLALAEVEARRAAELYKDKLIPQSEHDRAQADLKQAQATAKIRLANWEKAQADLKKTTIVAPIDGTVIARAVTMGQTVAASFNSPKLFNIINDLTKMEIHVSVSEVDIGEVTEGQKATFLVDAFPGRVFNGTITQVRNDPVTSSNVVNYVVVITTNNEDLKLKPGMTANASIILAERKDVLAVPRTALSFQPPKDALVKALPESERPRSSRSGRGSGGGGSGGGGGEDRRKRMLERFDKNGDGQLDESENAAMREEMQRRFGGGGGQGGPGGGEGRGGGGGGDRPRRSGGGPSAAPTEGIIHIMGKDEKTGKPLLIERKVKLGLDDGKNTEIPEGLKEDEVVVVSLDQPIVTPTATTAGGSSRGGGGMPGGFGGFGGGGFPGGGGFGGSGGGRGR